MLIKNKIKHNYTCPYSPHQNGTAERSWRTLFDMARALLIESKLPKFLWPYAINTAAYIRNRCFVQRIKDTPFHLITNKTPDLSKLHIFGSICYSYLNNGKKLDPRSKKGYFVGYDKCSPSYLVYYKEENKVMKHRVVHFTDKFENIVSDGFINEEFINCDSYDENNGFIKEENSEIIDNTDEGRNYNGNIINRNDSSRNLLNDNNVEKRYPTRTRKPPAHLNDYDLNTGEDAVNFIDYCYMLNIPISYEDALNCDDSLKWKLAMDREMETLKLNGTFTLVDLPENCKLVGGKWVYDIKGDPNDPIYKARYVAKGYSQTYGIDYFETFSPTTRMESVRVLMQLAMNYNIFVHQMDVKSAYLHAPIDCDLYVVQPKGYEILNESGKPMVFKLNKSLYGLKQSGRNWNNLLCSYLCDIGFTQSNVDPCIYTKSENGNLTIILVWVDDLIILCSSQNVVKEIKSKLCSKFKMKDLGEISTFLGISFKVTNDFISMDQSRYLENVLKRFSLYDCKGRSTPCEANLAAYEINNIDPDEIDNTKYRQMVGSLIYAATCTRPDLSFIVMKLSQNLSNPRTCDLLLLKHVFQYIKKTIDYALVFRKTENLKLIGYCDADWATNVDNRRSITGYCFSLSESGPVISWRSKKQNSVALSTCEAEYMAISQTCQELSFLVQLLKDIISIDFEPVHINNDNQGAIALVKNPVKHQKSKHIDIRYHFIREYYQLNKITLNYVPSNENFADIFTKPMKKTSKANIEKYLFGSI